jgi:hypothetical protein
MAQQPRLLSLFCGPNQVFVKVRQTGTQLDRRLKSLANFGSQGYGRGGVCADDTSPLKWSGVSDISST